MAEAAAATDPGGGRAGRRIVLVGAGHAHLHLLHCASDFARRNIELVVVAPEDFWYSGLATGVLGGLYPTSLDRIDIAAMLFGTGARLVRQRMSALDLDQRRIIVEDGSSIAFGALSLNLGSVVPPIPGATETAYAAKPVTRLIALHANLEDRFREDATPPAVAVVGGGVTGCEIAASIAELARRHDAKVDITLFAGSRLLANLPTSGARRLGGYLRSRGVSVRQGARVERIENNRLILDDRSTQEFEYLINATGLKPPPLTKSLGLPVTDDGALIVDRRLMSVEAEGVFAAGDCIAFRGQPLPRVGVYAIRQAPVIAQNVLAFLDGQDLADFVPQAHYLSIMTLGGGKGYAQRSRFWWLGRTSFLIKDWIDRRFLMNNQPPPSNRSLPADGNQEWAVRRRASETTLGPSSQSGVRHL